MSYPTGVSKTYAEQSAVEQYMLLIDSVAGTPIVKFDGTSFASMFFPFHDISYAAHAVRPDSRVAVIGVGGAHFERESVYA
jgi:hypothetical protein